MASEHTNKLALWMRSASSQQRKATAQAAGTSENYLYQVASLRREPSVSLAFRIEAAMHHTERLTDGLLPAVTARDIADAFALALASNPAASAGDVL